MELLLSIALAFSMDLLIGDPPRLPHPIRWMGAAIGRLEPRFRKLPLPEAVSGLFFAVTLVGGAWGVTALVLFAARLFHPFLAFGLQTLLIYYALAVTSLKAAALDVHAKLVKGDLAVAREHLSMIVSRETGHLDTTGISRAAVETVAENLVDGVISPLFFAVLGGAPLAMAFKMTSTLDSMVGYKTDRYLLFGKASARMDDAANFLPARLSVFVVALSARLLGLPGGRALSVVRREARHHASPNAGFPEAAFAGALGVKLNGPNRYHGKWVDKPCIGKDLGPATPAHIPAACRLMALSATLFMAAAVLIRWVFTLAAA